MVMSLLSSTMTAAAADHPDPADTPATMSKMQAYVNAMEPGWNLGNSLDAVGEDETAWETPHYRGTDTIHC